MKKEQLSTSQNEIPKTRNALEEKYKTRTIRNKKIRS